MNKTELIKFNEQLINEINRLHAVVKGESNEKMTDLDHDLILAQVSAMSTLAYIVGFRIHLGQNVLNEETQAAEETSNKQE